MHLPLRYEVLEINLIITFTFWWTVGSILSSCELVPAKCDETTCMNQGKCTEGWNRYICDCSATSFTGPTCGKGMYIRAKLGLYRVCKCVTFSKSK